MITWGWGWGGGWGVMTLSGTNSLVTARTGDKEAFEQGHGQRRFRSQAGLHGSAGGDNNVFERLCRRAYATTKGPPVLLGEPPIERVYTPGVRAR